MNHTTGNTPLDGLVASDSNWMTLHEVHRTLVTHRSGMLKHKQTSVQETLRTGRHISRSDFLNPRAVRVADQALTAAASLVETPAVQDAEEAATVVNISRILFHFIDSLLTIEAADRRGEQCADLFRRMEVIADEFATAAGKVADLPALSIPLPPLADEETLPQLTATLNTTVEYNPHDKEIPHD